MRTAMDRLTDELGAETTHQWFDVMSKVSIAMDVLENESGDLNE